MSLAIAYLSLGLLFLLYCYRRRFKSRVWENIRSSPERLILRILDRGVYISPLAAKTVMYSGVWLGWVFILIGIITAGQKREKGS